MSSSNSGASLKQELNSRLGKLVLCSTTSLCWAVLPASQVWMMPKLWELYAPSPQEIYAEGEFQGMSFLKFDTGNVCDTALRIVRVARCKEGGNHVWIQPVKPLDIRVLKSFIFGTKHALSKYCGNKNQFGLTSTRLRSQGSCSWRRLCLHSQGHRQQPQD